MSVFLRFSAAIWAALGVLSLRAIAARAKLREVSEILNALRGPIIVSIIGVVAFAAPGQTLEIYWLFAEDFSTENFSSGANLRFIAFLALLWAVCYVLWYVARLLTLSNPVAMKALTERDYDGTVARWGPRWIGAAPAFGAAIGLLRASTGGDGVIGPDPTAEAASIYDASTEVLVLCAAAAIAALIGLGRLWVGWRRMRRKPSLYKNLQATLFRLDVRLVLAFAVVSVTAFLCTSPIETTQQIGAFAIMCLFLIALGCGLGLLTFIYDRYAIPALTLLIAGAFLWSALDVNDNHYVRQRPLPEIDTASGPQTLQPAGDMTVVEAFRAWLDARANRAAFDAEGRPYPVYLVAAQGGGVYAAYQSAIFLARLQDACPTFAQHVFGISGVSGGAVGATVFASLAKRFAENQPGPVGGGCPEPIDDARAIEPKVRDILRQDFLSPLLNGLLFSDFTARFSPVPIPGFDRAQALEIAFEQAWERTGAEGESPLVDGLLAYWTPEGAAPAVFLNAAETETGRRLVLSPIFDLGDDLRSYALVSDRPEAADAPPPAPPGFAVTEEEERERLWRIPAALRSPPLDMALSTAMILSARFPYATPAASIDLYQEVDPGRPPEPRKTRLVDGGYFENSGIATAAEIIDMIDAEARAQNVDIRLIAFDLTTDAYREPSYALGEILSPIRAILSARSSRAEIAQRTVRRDFTEEGTPSNCRYLDLDGATPWRRSQACSKPLLADSRIWSVSLNDYEYDFELGWILSRDTLARIDQQLGAPTECRVAVRRRETAPSGGTRSVGAPSSAERAYQEVREERVRRTIEQSRKTGDGTAMGDFERIALTGEEEAIEIHNSCVAEIALSQLSP